MKTIPAYRLINLGHSLHWMQTAGLITEMESRPEDRAWRKKNLVETADNIARHLADFGCPHTSAAAYRLKEALEMELHPISETEFTVRAREIKESFAHELSSHLFFYVPTERAKYYDETLGMFGNNVKDRFPSTISEIKNAGECFAFAQYTAAVFHLMRVMESALRAVSKSLGVNIDKTKNWGDMLIAINPRELKNIPAADQIYKSHQRFYDDVRVTLSSVKDAWRNLTMHLDRRYDEAEAEDVLRAVKTFMGIVALNIDESGVFVVP